MKKRVALSGLLLMMVACSGGGEGTKPSGGSGGNSKDDAGASATPDAGVADAGVDPFTLQCPLSGEHIDLPLASPANFALATQTNVGLIAYGGDDCESGDGTALELLRVPSGSGAPEMAMHLDGAKCEQRLAPALAVAGSRAFAYFTRRSGDGDVLLASEVTEKAASPVVLLSDAGRQVTAAAGGAIGGHPAVAWASRIGDGGASEISLFFDDVAASRRVLLEAREGHVVTALAIGPLGQGKEKTVTHVLAWADARVAGGGVYMQPLDARGIPKGERQLLSSVVGADGNFVAVAALAEGGAVVFAQGPHDHQQLRLVPFDAEGAALRPPVSITNSEQVYGAAVVPYAAGFAVAYRSFPSDSAREAVIRLAFVDNLGNLGGRRDLAPAARREGGIRAALARDGRIFVAWEDPLGDGTTRLRAVRGICDR